MNKNGLWMLGVAITLSIIMGCSHTDYRQVAGTLDGPLPADTAPAEVMDAITNAQRYHQHDIMGDTANAVWVFSLDEVDLPNDRGVVDQRSTAGYGIVVMKGAVTTTFPHIRNVRQPQAAYDAATGNLWLTSSVMEGTGVQVERLYRIRFDDNDSAYVAGTIEPYDMQQALCQRLCYSIDGEQVTLYDGHRLIATATNTVSDMGGFDDEQPLWIGEQLAFDLSGNAPVLLVTPGVSFTTGLVLTYDDMPTLRAPLTIGDDGMASIGEITSEGNTQE